MRSHFGPIPATSCVERTMLRTLVCLFVAVGCRSAAVQPPRVAPATTEDACGNGTVDAGELCDPDVKWADRCPDGWGMCWKCGPSCKTLLPSFSEVVESIPQDVFCTQEIPGSTIVRTFDARGN